MGNQMTEPDFIHFKAGDVMRFENGEPYGTVTATGRCDKVGGRIPVMLHKRPPFKTRLRDTLAETADRLEAIWHIAWHGDGRYYDND